MSQDFSGQNLRGRSFKGQNLERANFSYADIRGADFTGANLTGANFSHTQAGLQKRWAIFLVCVSWLLSGIAGFIWSINGYLVSLIFDISGLENQIVGWTILILLIAYFFATILQGVGTVGGAVAFAIAGAAAFAVAGSVAVILVGVKVALEGGVGIGAGAGALALAFAVAGSVGGSVGGSVVFAIAGTIALAVSFAIAVAFAIAGSKVVPIVVVYAFALATQGIDLDLTFDKFSAGAVTLDGAGTLLSIYIAWRAMKGDEKYALIRNIAVAFAASGGTSFHNANLTDANFTEALLKSTDFRKANLTRTCFHKTKKLDRVRPGTTYLQKAKVVSVLVNDHKQNKNFQDKNFDREDLRGVNFQKANLVDASFIGADLSQANLQDTDLSRAKLVQTQLNGTDFTGATLTGAYIQDWGITTDTKFDGVRCEYVYMRLTTRENPDPLRKPDNHRDVFADGEFGDFIKPIFDTLDLYHNQGVDPRAIAISFKRLAENHPDAELEIVAIEKRGEDKVLLRAKTAATADKSQLSAEYFDSYNQLKALSEREIKLLLEEKDNRIRSLENMIVTALQSPKFYTQGNTSMTGDRNIKMGDGNYIERIERIERDYIQGNYYAAGQPQNLAEAAAEIQQLLKQLEQTYPTTTTSQQMVVAAEAISRIESNPTLKKRVINAVKEGGLAAFEKAIDNPAGAFIVGAIKGWQEVETQD